MSENIQFTRRRNGKDSWVEEEEGSTSESDESVDLPVPLKVNTDDITGESLLNAMGYRNTVAERNLFYSNSEQTSSESTSNAVSYSNRSFYSHTVIFLVVFVVIFLLIEKFK